MKYGKTHDCKDCYPLIQLLTEDLHRGAKQGIWYAPHQRRSQGKDKGTQKRRGTGIL